MIQAVQRAGGRTDRAQEEVLVVEHDGRAAARHAARRTCGPDAIAALPPGEQLLGYCPYQPGMAIFGLPRAVAGDAWWTDARIWFALVDGRRARRHGVGCCATPARRPLRGPCRSPPSPVCALTLATGGDDLPVLALCLLALALCAVRPLRRAPASRSGPAAALKLFAWPVAAVLIVHAADPRTAGRGRGSRPARSACPLLALVPAAAGRRATRWSRT